MNLEKIQAMADENLSNYDGYLDDGSQGFEDGDGYEGEEYTGFGDDLLEHGFEGGSFGTEMNGANQFTFMLINTSANNTVEVSICPSLNPTLATNTLRDGVIPYPGHNSDLQATSLNGKPINYFLEHIKHNPTRCVGFGFDLSSGESKAFFSTVVKVEQKSPYSNLGSRTIQIQNFQDPKNFQDKLLRVPTQNLQFDNQTEIIFTIPPATKLLCTLYMGTSLNNARGLFNKAKKAGRSRKVIATRAAIAGK